MKKLLEFLIKSIVDHPDQVIVNESQEGEWFNLILKANPEDLKIIIGRNGRTIRAIRHLIRTKAFKRGKRIKLTVEEQDGQGGLLKK